MPFHKGLLPREGFCLDVILNLIRSTALNPNVLVPLLLLARFTKKGQDLSILHSTALGRLHTLCYLAVARSLSNWYSDKVSNNWTSDSYDWSKEIVLITGGSGGIGGAIVRLLDELGVKVVVVDVQPMGFSTSPKVHYYNCDIRSPEKVNAIADKIRAEIGHPTVVINNAGVARGKTILEAEPNDVRFTFDVNTFANFWITKAFLPNMISSNHGMVVTVASAASWLTLPNMVDYGGSKAAALAFHEGLSAELKTRYGAPKVRTVIVHPGHTTTPLFKGYNQNTAFVMPEQHPDSMAEAIVKQILTGRSGTVILPQLGSLVAAVRAMPEWYGRNLRVEAEKSMSKWDGRQVIANISSSQEEKTAQNETSESTVLVPDM